MPVLATTAYPQASEVFSLIRSLLMDADIPFTVTIPPTGAVRTLLSVATITTNSPHNLQPGNTVQVQSVSDNSFNGTQVVTSVPTPTTFQYLSAGANTTSGNGIVAPVIQGDVWTDTVLIPLVNKAFRKVQTKLQENGSPTQKSETIITLPIGTTQLLDSTNPQLPVDFLSPRTLQERISGQPYFNSPMIPVFTIPSGPQTTLNGVYAWFEEGLFFPGALSIVDIKLDYNLAYPDVTDGQSPLTIRGCTDVVADYGAFLAVQSRSPTVAAGFKGMFDEDMKEFLNQQAHARQYKPVRRRPNNAGRRGAFSGWGYQR